MKTVTRKMCSINLMIYYLYIQIFIPVTVFRCTIPRTHINPKCISMRKAATYIFGESGQDERITTMQHKRLYLHVTHWCNIVCKLDFLVVLPRDRFYIFISIF
jgi:hypothetical protein